VERRTFLAFVAPSLGLMLLFIAAPLVAVLHQSFHVTRPIFETVVVENCVPSFLTQTCTRETKTRPVVGTDGKIVAHSSFVGLESYRNVLQLDRAAAALAVFDIQALLSIDFWRALRFTLTFTFVTLPFVLGIGLALALAIDTALAALRGAVIFVSLLPFIITPVIGALSIRWLFIGDGILTAALEWWLARDVALFAQGWTIEILMMVYRVWHVAPFAFVVFYAALQTVNREQMEAAFIDGATRWQRLRFVVIPHLLPLITFVALIHLMDSYRVFEEIVGFSSQGHVISLQWLTYDLLRPDDSGNRSLSRASASAVLTMTGIVILLVPLLRRAWREHRVGP
jgi:multiple sugar transport system permease protein